MLVATDEALLTLSDRGRPDAVALGVGSPSLSAATAGWVFRGGSLSDPDAKSTALLLVSLVRGSTLLVLEENKKSLHVRSMSLMANIRDAPSAHPVSECRIKLGKS